MNEPKKRVIQEQMKIKQLKKNQKNQLINQYKNNHKNQLNKLTEKNQKNQLLNNKLKKKEIF